MPLENRREALLALATAADRLGYDGFFLPETWAYDVTVLLAEAALRTSASRSAPASCGVWSRSAATLAMAAATLASVSGGRFVLGLGASTPQLTEGLHDVPFAAPRRAHAAGHRAGARAAARRARPAGRGHRRPTAEAQRAVRRRSCRSTWRRSPTQSVRLAGELAMAGRRSSIRASTLRRGRSCCARARRAAAIRPGAGRVPLGPAVVAEDPARRARARRGSSRST